MLALLRRSSFFLSLDGTIDLETAVLPSLKRSCNNGGLGGHQMGTDGSLLDHFFPIYRYCAKKGFGGYYSVSYWDLCLVGAVLSEVFSVLSGGARRTSKGCLGCAQGVFAMIF
jgi:hypothetical protein